MTILDSLALPPADYFPERQHKDLIVLHHTVGASAASTVASWRQNARRIATAYLIDRDGAIYRAFPDDAWAFHVGLKSTRTVDRRSIGIEIASEGPLEERDGGFYSFGRISLATRFNGTVYDHGCDWRGCRHFAAYTRAALESVYALVEKLLTIYSIPRQMPAPPGDVVAPDGNAGEALYQDYRGVLAHCHLRPDKTDVHPGFPWQELALRCRLQATEAAMPAAR